MDGGVGCIGCGGVKDMVVSMICLFVGCATTSWA